jgi:hypothetical protein
MIDISRLTIGEAARVEEISGQSITDIADPAKPKARVMIGVAYVMRKRDDPKVKVSDIENLTLDELHTILSSGDDEPKSE